METQALSETQNQNKNSLNIEVIQKLQEEFGHNSDIVAIKQ